MTKKQPELKGILARFPVDVHRELLIKIMRDPRYQSFQDWANQKALEYLEEDTKNLSEDTKKWSIWTLDTPDDDSHGDR